MQPARPEVERLYQEYQFYWRQTAAVQIRRTEGKPTQAPRLTPERYKLFAELYDWCRKHEIDPHLWVFVLFRVRNWHFAPQLLRGHLLSENMRKGDKFQKILDRGTLDGYLRQKKGKLKSEADPNRDLIPMAEVKKRNFAQKGEAGMCMLLIYSETYGYHPKSQWCRRCPLTRDCEERIRSLVPFDIIALRNGEITAEQAQAEAKAASQ